MTFNAELTRKGPGLLVRDLMRFEDPLLRDTLDRIVELAPDILALQSIDHDHDLIGLKLVQERLAELGHAMPHHFMRPPNTGVATGFDLNRDGELDTASDRQGYGFFSGHGGIALLSKYPVHHDEARDHSTLLWRDKPDASLPQDYFSDAELAVLRLQSVAAWDVPVELPNGTVRVLMTQASSPVFDGPENRNGLRNADQLWFWTEYIKTIDGPFVLMGGLNNDPFDGEGDKPSIRALLGSSFLQDPKPATPDHVIETAFQSGPAEMDTVNWGPRIGSLRVDYILPSLDFAVEGAGVARQSPEDRIEEGVAHSPVWVDLSWR